MKFLSQGGAWQVPSQSEPGTVWTVQFTSPCQEPTCLRCRECRVCKHMAHCTCPISERGHLCKHIHAVVFHFSSEVEPLIAGAHPAERKHQELQLLNELSVNPVASTRHRLAAIAAVMDEDQLQQALETCIGLCASPKTPHRTPTHRPPPRNERITPQRVKPPAKKRRRLELVEE